MQMLVDIHVHLADSRFSDTRGTIRAAEAAEVGWVLGTAAQFKDWQVLMSLANRFSVCHCALGIHPWYADEWSPATAERLRQRLNASPVVAIGEIGLDFGPARGNKENQLGCFEEQLKLAHAFEKPVILHVYKAWPAMRRLIKDTGLPRPGGVWHGFTRGPELAQEALDMGLHLSFGGGVTDERNSRCRAAAAYVPDDRLLVESDGPNQPGAHMSGPVSAPAHVVDVYETLAAIRGVSVSSLAAAVAGNTARLFEGDPSGSAGPAHFMKKGV